MKNVIPAKLTPPNTKVALPRERLFQLIEQNCEKKVLWISGPAGSGKTTLAASYFQHHNVPCLWYQLDEGDTDISTFFYYMGLAVKKACPGVKHPLPLLTPEYLHGIPVFAKRFFEQLCNRLIAKISVRSSCEKLISAIVFDNYQELPDDSLFHSLIRYGIDSVPNGVNVIILSRGEPPPAYSRSLAAGEMYLLGWRELRLTPDEADAIARIKAGKELQSRALSLLRKASDGWVAGLMLLLEANRIEDLDSLPLDDLPREEIFGYFTSELFDRNSRETKQFLLETSFLPKMSARMVCELTNNPKAGRIFADLDRKNYFTDRYFSRKEVLQYHPLFREFLMGKAHEVIDPARLAIIKNRAAGLLETSGDLEDALALFLEMQDWPEAIRVLLANAPALIAQGRSRALLGWIESLPDPAVENEPWLLYWMGVCIFSLSPDAGDYFARALEQFRNRKDAAGSFLAVSGMLDSVFYRLDEFVELDKLIALAHDILEEYRYQFPSPEIESGMVASMLYALMLRQPDNPVYKYWEKRGLALTERVADVDTTVRILLALAMHRTFSGDLERVPLVLDSFSRLIEANHCTPITLITIRNIKAFYYWLSADFDQNQQAAEEGMRLADDTGVRTFSVFLAAHRAASLLSTGEFAKAAEFLDKMWSLLKIAPSAWGETFYHHLVGWSCLVQRDPARASRHANLAFKLSSASGAPFTMPIEHLLNALVLHELRKDEEAFEHISRVWKLCASMRMYQVEFMTLLLEARIAFGRGDATLGNDVLRKAMALGKEHGFTNTFFWVDSSMAELCVKALELEIETDYVRDLIRRRKLSPDAPAFHLDSWPWPLRIYTLGYFEIVVGSHPLRFAGKVQKKALLMLKAIIAFGGKQVSEGQLCDALWPDAEGDLAHRSFESTLYRLRRLIGGDKIFELSDGKLSIDMNFCWVDAFALEYIFEEVETFRELLGQPEFAPRQDLSAKAIELTKRTIAIYKGHFLDTDADLPWAIPPKERLRAKYLRGVQTLGGYWEKAGEPERAITCYEKALEVDDLAEDLYQRVIVCHLRLGRQAQAQAVYRRCRSILRARLDLEPSDSTKSLLN